MTLLTVVCRNLLKMRAFFLPSAKAKLKAKLQYGTNCILLIRMMLFLFRLRDWAYYVGLEMVLLSQMVVKV